MNKVQQTKDYTIFKTLTGNRGVDSKHVSRLQRLLLKRGNLTPQFPVVINRHGEVIDGQHRLEALKNLGWEVFYTIQDNLNLEDVRAINIGHRNWGWRDYAESYAALGNQDYARFLKLADEFKKPYNILLLFCGSGTLAGGGHKTDKVGFKDGELKLSYEKYVQAQEMLGQAAVIQDTVGIHDRAFVAALYRVFQSPNYDYKRMLIKVGNRSAYSALYKAHGVEENLRAIEDVYNMYARQDDIVRLF